ncbi:LysR family transcriptional regulator [Amycolatopsis ultiminotia]|uniref:LysR family transcriptional regulator n=1 Tax=Amycolatopsis ultiminotia TaxID=543629 RepID=A0ABP6Y2Y4_9PSEU
MELEFVRTFVAVVDEGQFQEAAFELGITQQAVSKRVGALERELGVRLFTRTARGARLSDDGRAFLPHARALLLAGERAVAAVRPGRRPLRVDVLNRRIAPSALLRKFHRAYPEVELDVVTLPELDAAGAVAAVAEGVVDVTFRAVPAGERPGGVVSARVYDDRHQVLVGPRHPLASAASVTPADLAGYRIWMPGMAPGTEWAAYYAELSAAFGLSIDVAGPDFGNDALLDELAASPDLATFVGIGSRYVWPPGYALRRIPVVDPTPVYPHSMLWRREHAHPALAKLRDHLVPDRRQDAGVWLPEWARG